MTPDDIITNAIGMKFKLIPAGKFMMGDESWGSSFPLHRVKITKPFYLGIYQVTQREWTKVMENNPSAFKKNDDNPVETVSWEDCQMFIGKLNEIEPEACYRLPREAEWEYSCRAGSFKRYCNEEWESKLGKHGWYIANSGEKTHPVGKKKPNPWGLYDMHGNVWEWCWDWFDEKYYQKCHEHGTVDDPEGPAVGSDTTLWRGFDTPSEVKDPEGPVVSSDRVKRGGAWSYDAESCLPGYRLGSGLSSRHFDTGFRLARTIP